MAVTPDNSHFHQQWNLRTIRAPEAWEVLRSKSADLTFGSSDIIVAIIDTGVQTDPTRPPVVAGIAVPMHTAFSGSVRDGSPNGTLKAVGFLRYSNNYYADNDVIVGIHGSGAAGIALASASHPSGFSSNSAVVGVAPNCRLLSVEFGLRLVFYWAANMKLDYGPSAELQTFVVPTKRVQGNLHADILNLSFASGSSDFPWNMGFDCTTFGRDGRGITIIQSSGNDDRNNSTGSVPDGYSRRITLVGATMIADDDKGDHDVFVTEVRAPYSNFGTRLDLCAPAGGQKGLDVTSDQHQTYTTVPRDCGTFDLDPHSVWEVTVSKVTSKTYTVVSIQKPAVPFAKIGVFPGQFITIGDSGTDTYEMRQITAVDRTGPLSVVTISSAFNNLENLLNLAHTKATIAYQFATISAATSANSLPVNDAEGFRSGQEIYVFDATHFDFATIGSISGNNLQLQGVLSGAGYSAGAQVVASGQTLNITRYVSQSLQETVFEVAGDGFFVGQMVLLRSALYPPQETNLTAVAPGPGAHQSTVTVFGKFSWFGE